MFKILSFDGGGLRAIFQARLLERIEEERGRMIKPDMYAGTSAGAIVACAHQRIPSKKIVDFFLEDGPKIFKRENFFQEIDDLFNILESRYKNKELKAALERVFGDSMLSTLATKTLITSFQLQSPDGYWQPAVFHNIPTAEPKDKVSIVDALLRSTAAPTYFPVYQGYCDGGVWGNNPSTSALSAATDEYVGNKEVKKISVLSIGTGRRPQQLKGSKRSLGLSDWVKSGLIDILKDANVEASHYYTKSLLGARYHRVQFTLDPDIRLDDSKGLDDMIDFANLVDLAPILSWMEGFWDDSADTKKSIS